MLELLQTILTFFIASGMIFLMLSFAFMLPAIVGYIFIPRATFMIFAFIACVLAAIAIVTSTRSHIIKQKVCIGCI